MVMEVTYPESHTANFFILRMLATFLTLKTDVHCNYVKEYPDIDVSVVKERSASGQCLTFD